ncbi:serine phosphatase RsbU (regulator of sigma subunit) [Catenulispora sp. GP43]|uniref:PP2C family protein-serine/threonine phosphatase n=1 Tax=Catenulispora sp. GP43 TaxID=3156263 RepID=UPI003517FFA7
MHGQVSRSEASGPGRPRAPKDDDARIVERLQRSLLPSVLEVKGLVTAAEYIPAARHHNVGGDWYDVFEPVPGTVTWVIGDVAGHGFGEAVVMAQLRNALRAYALDTDDPAEILRRLDRFVTAYLPNDTTATACVLVLDRATGRLRYSRAGHPPPLLLAERRGSYAAHWLDQGQGLPLGVRETEFRPVAELALIPADMLVLYTDGLVEKPGDDIEDGMERLRMAAQLVCAETPETVCRQLMRLPGEAYAGDDRALLVSRIS